MKNYRVIAEKGSWLVESGMWIILYHSHTGIYKEKHILQLRYLDFSHLSEASNVVLYPNFGPVLKQNIEQKQYRKKKAYEINVPYYLDGPHDLKGKTGLQEPIYAKNRITLTVTEMRLPHPQLIKLTLWWGSLRLNWNKGTDHEDIWPQVSGVRHR